MSTVAVPDGWRQVGQGTLPGTGVVAAWRHDSGATHLHRCDDVADFGFGLSVRTEARDDTGAAHVVEHLLGAGSSRYPTSSPLYSAMFRCMGSFMNSFTETGRTSYTFVTTDPDDHTDLLDVLLDGLFAPRLGRREFLREGCRHLPADSKRPGTSGLLRGVVYNEMTRKRETERQWVSRLVHRAHRPGHTVQFRHEGALPGLAALTYEQCVSLYKRWYRPEYMHSFSSGPVLEGVLRRLGDAYAVAAARQPPTESAADVAPGELYGPPGLPATDWAVAQVSCPGADRHTGWRQALGVRRQIEWRWRGDKPLLTTGPHFVDGSLSLVFATRDGRPSALAEAVWPLLGSSDDGPAAAPAAAVDAHLGAVYATLPDVVAWGLRLAVLRVNGVDPLQFHAATESTRAPEIKARPEACIGAVSAAEQPTAGLWSPQRAREDRAIWTSAAVPAAATCLPLRPLRTRSMPPLPHLRQRASSLWHLPGPASRQLYLWSVLPLDPATAHLLHPLGNALVRGCAPAPSTALGAHVGVRSGTDGWCVADVLVQVDDAVDPTDAAARMTLDSERAAELAHEVTKQFLLRRSAAMRTASAPFARRGAAGQLGTVGAAAEAVDGLVALDRVKRALNEPTTLGAVLADLSRMWRGSLRGLIIVGGADPDHFADAAARLTEEGSTVSRLRPPSFAAPLLVPHGLPAGHGTCCRAWSTERLDAGLGPAVNVLAEHLHRAYLHPEVREARGTYGVGVTVDQRSGALSMWAESDPDPERTTQYFATLLSRSEVDQPSADDVATAQLMAVQSERRRRADLTYLTAEACGALGTIGTREFAKVGGDEIRAAAQAVGGAPSAGTTFA